MVSSRFQAELLVRVAMLTVTTSVLAWTAVHTRWYMTSTLLAAAVVLQVVMVMHHAAYASRQFARFLDAVSADEPSLTFQALGRDRAFRELGGAMTRVLDRLRIGRAEREEQAHYLQALVTHVPVPLVAVQDKSVKLLNVAARRLFEGPCTTVEQLSRYGTAFVTGIESLRPGEHAVLRMERASGTVQLKVTATDFVRGAVAQRLISLMNIESELSARDLVAWQTVIRVMAHEVINSLTPVASLAATAHELVSDVVERRPDDVDRGALADASDALEAVMRRSQGLLSFVENQRPLTTRMVANVDVVPLRRVFARLHRLLAADLTARDIQFTLVVEPETLEIAADSELLDQALINVVRNAIEALRDVPGGRIRLSASREEEGHVVVKVADNGPGIAPDQREKVFVPFFTTKHQGSGIGLTLVRQIATVHNATVSIGDTEGGGATVALRF